MDVGSFYVYIVESSILITTCLAVAVPIFLNPRLRSQKEYIIFGGSAIFDALFGLAYLSAGAWRLAILYSETCKFYLYESLFCYLTLISMQMFLSILHGCASIHFIYIFLQ